MEAEGSTDDPGWGGWRALLVLIPGGAQLGHKPDSRPAGHLVVLRLLFLSFATALGAMAVVVLILAATSEDLGFAVPAGAAAVVVAVIGALALVGVRHLAHTDLDCESDLTLLTSHRNRAFRVVACFEAPALAGFVGFVLSGQPLVFFVGLVFSVVGFVMGAPTRSNLRRDEEALAESGCGRSLLKALREPEGLPPQSPIQ